MTTNEIAEFDAALWQDLSSYDFKPGMWHDRDRRDVKRALRYL